ncbi:hypothetical protein X777_10312, partial [Ooceraea biroi]
MVGKLFVKYTIMPLMQKLLNAFPSGLLKLRLGLRDQNSRKKRPRTSLWFHIQRVGRISLRRLTRETTFHLVGRMSGDQVAIQLGHVLRQLRAGEFGLVEVLQAGVADRVGALDAR